MPIGANYGSVPLSTVTSSAAAGTSSFTVPKESEWAQVHHAKTKSFSKAAASKKIVGTASGNSIIRSAGPTKTVRRVVFHIDNIISDSTASDVVSFLQSNDIEVLTCDPAKSWMKPNTRCVAMRVCVQA